MSLRIGRKAATVAVSVAPIVGAAVAKAFVDFQNGALVTTEYEIKSNHVTKAMDGFRIVQVSDLHDASFGFQNERLVEAVRNGRPDLILLTGDMIHKDTIENTMMFVRHAVSIAPVVFVPGNHESYSPRYPEFRSQMMQAGAFVLEDGVLTERDLGLGRAAGNGIIRVPEVTVIGVADPLFSPWLDRAEPGRLMTQKLDELVPEATEREAEGRRPFRILLTHRPELFASYAREDIDLVLAGHAHGGQWRIPVLGGLYAPSQGMFPRYASGLHEEGNTRMVISRGLGNSGFPLRLNNRPEVVVVTLRSDSRVPSPVDFRNKAMGIGKGVGMVSMIAREAADARSAISERTEPDSKGKRSGNRGMTKEILKSAAKDAAIQEAPHMMQEIIAGLTPLVVSALIGKTFLADKSK